MMIGNLNPFSTPPKLDAPPAAPPNAAATRRSAPSNRPEDAVADLKRALQHGYTTASVESETEFEPLRNRADYKALISQFAPKKK